MCILNDHSLNARLVLRTVQPFSASFQYDGLIDITIVVFNVRNIKVLAIQNTQR